MGIASGRTALKNTLDGVVSLSKVHKYEQKRFDVLPSASIFFDGFEGRDRSMANHETTYRYIVRVAVKLHDADAAQTELDGLIDDIISTVAQDTTLGTGGSFFNAMVTTGEVVVVQDQRNAQLVADLTINMDELVSR